MAARPNRAGLLSLAFVALAACKDSHAPATSQQPATQPPSAQQPPALPSPPTQAGSATQAGSETPPTLDVIPNDTLTPQSLSETEATDVLPKLGGSVVIPMKASADHRQVHGTWCLPGSGADGVASDVAAKLTAAGWKNVATRGDATKAGLSAERGGYHASYIVSASSIATCAAPTHYFASLTMFKLRD